MELLQLRYFLDVAETEHVTRSAERLHVAQPAVTQALHRLEAELGVPLFTRVGRRVALNECGRYFRERLTPLAEAFFRLPEEVKTMANLSNATIHLNVLAASALVTDAIARYVRRNERASFQMTQYAENRLFDISVTARPSAAPAARPTDSRYVCTENIYMAVPARGEYADRSEIRLAELREAGFVSLQSSSPMRAICDAFCRRAGFTPRILFESDNPGAVRNMIAANMGIGFWPELTWGEIDSDRVKLLTLREPLCQRDILIEKRRNKADSTEVDRFFDFLTAFLEARRRG